MRTIKHAYQIAIALLFVFAAYGLAGKWTHEDEVKTEEHAEHLARKYWLRDAGREREEMRQLAVDVQFAELSEGYRRKK